MWMYFWISICSNHSYRGESMNYTIKTMKSFTVIGFQKEFSNTMSYNDIPDFWGEVFSRYPLTDTGDIHAKAICENGIGEFGICIDDLGPDKFRYLIAGRYAGGEVPEDMVLYTFPESDWAVFDCTGPIPEAIKTITPRIYTEWMPEHPEYGINGDVTVEWYDAEGDMIAENYHSAVWIPVYHSK